MIIVRSNSESDTEVVRLRNAAARKSKGQDILSVLPAV